MGAKLLWFFELYFAFFDSPVTIVVDAFYC